jgi:para-nitrobenzyl esterase
MPVYVFIHGGGFAGAAASQYDGTPLASTNDMVVVMIEYRLGVFGWLANPALDAETPDASSGNYGFLDMVRALRWIQENIRAFGGNPENVTIAGNSAGGISVCALITASLEHEKLFRRAIIGSGECTHSSSFIVTHSQALSRGNAVVTKLGCTDPATAASCLRSASTSALQAATAGLPAVSVANVGGALMSQHPIDAIPETKHMVPVMLGGSHDESRRAPLPITGFPATVDSYKRYLTLSFGANASLVAAQYPASAYPDPAYAAGAVASDSGFPSGIGVCPVLVELADALAKVTKTYAWELNDPDGGVNGALTPGFQVGSQHGAEMKFIYNLATIQPQTRTPGQQEMTARFLRHWGSFAHNGDPDLRAHDWPRSDDDSDSRTDDWPRFDKSHQVLRFQPTGDALVSETTVSDEHRCAFWSGMGL